MNSILNRNILIWILLVPVLLALGVGVFAAMVFRSEMATRSSCLGNERTLGVALMLYAEDYEECLPPPSVSARHGGRIFWISLIAGYLDGGGNVFNCPDNSAKGDVDRRYGLPYPCSYAINGRFDNYFMKGPFPLTQLDIPYETAMLVEAGGERRNGPFAPPASNRAACVYWDTADFGNIYPSPHAGKMCVLAADGHAAAVKVEHYDRINHNPIYGCLGDEIYNWNGGFPNGRTDLPPAQ